MKNKLILIALALLTPVLVLNFYYPAKESNIPVPPVPVTNNFILGAMDNAKDVSYSDISNPDVFGMNIWHRYSGYETINYVDYPLGWTANDRLTADSSEYQTEVKNILKTTADHNMKSLLTRPKIEWLAYGQRSDYQCETVSMSDNFWFYSFKSNQSGHVHTGSNWLDNTSYGNNTMVKRCLTGTGGEDSPPGYVVDRLKAIRQQ